MLKFCDSVFFLSNPYFPIYKERFVLIVLNDFYLFSVPGGVEAFSQFLRTEFSEENIEFWLLCEEYKSIDSKSKLLSKAKYIYTVFIESEAPKEVCRDIFIPHKSYKF